MPTFVRIPFIWKVKKYEADERISETLKLMDASCISGEITKQAISSELRDNSFFADLI
jgi:hypothetical protein